MGCDCGKTSGEVDNYRQACDKLDAVLRDLASLRLRVEEVLESCGKAPRVDPEVEKEGQAEAAERAKQKVEAFLRLRRERGKTEEVDDEDRDILADAWMNS